MWALSLQFAKGIGRVNIFTRPVIICHFTLSRARRGRFSFVFATRVVYAAGAPTKAQCG